MTEHTLQSQIVRILRGTGFITIDGDVMSALRYLPARDNRRFLFISQHSKMGYTKGQPDLIVLLSKGRVLLVEMKNGKLGRQSLEQKKFQKQMEAMGHDYRVWRSVEDAVAFVRKERGEL
jgi:VRR-NUC domain